MPNFVVTLKFIEVQLIPPPKLTDLLFYEAQEHKLARGWVDENGAVVLIGGQWKPTHYAEHHYPILTAEARARHLLENATKQPSRAAFDSYPEKYLIVQRNTELARVMECEVVAAHNSEYSAREAWANWTVHAENNCWYEFVLNTKARP